MLRRRRRQRLDRDVAAAAAAAAAGAYHSRTAFDDDEEKPAMSPYGGYYAGTTPGLDVHGQPQPTMGRYDYEDPAGGYDPYVSELAAGDRMSTVTVPGVAGFGAQSAQATYAAPTTGYDSQGYETLDQPDVNGTATGHPLNGEEPGYYFDPKQAYNYAEDDAYDQERQYPSRHQRSGSEASVMARGGEMGGLKVTNV